MNATQAIETRLSRDELAERHKAYLTAIQPLIRAKCSILATCMPTYLLHGDGRLEKASDGVNPEQQALLNHADQLIVDMQKAFGLKTKAVDTTPAKPENPRTTIADPAQGLAR